MFATLLTALVLAQAPKIEIKEDPIGHKKNTTVNLGEVAKSKVDGFEMDLLLHYDSGTGVRPALKPDDKVLMHFSSRAETWQFLKYRPVVLADGGSSIELGEPKHRGSAFRGGVGESIMPRIRFTDLERLASEPNLKGKVGVEVFELSDDQQAVLRKYVARLKVGEDEARKLETADRQQEEAARAKQQAEDDKKREQVDAIKQEWFEARQGCTKRAKAATSSAKAYQNVLQRNIDKALIEVAQKHNMKPSELIALLGNSY